MRRDGWFKEEELEGLTDFWRVYEASYEDLQTLVTAALLKHPTLGPHTASIPPAQQTEQAVASRHLLAHAVAHNEWGEYEELLRSQGATYGSLAVTFSDWHDVVRRAGALLLPEMAKAYGGDVSRLLRAIHAMQLFFDGVVGVLGDSYIATKERAVRASEEESEQLLSATLASIQEGVMIGDENGNLVYQNQSAMEMLGPQSPILSIGTDSLRENGIFLPDELTPWPPSESPVERALRGEEFHDIEMFIRNKTVPNGVHISLNGGPLYGHDGTIRGTVTSFRDVSHKKHLEEERARAAQLELAGRKEREANLLKSEFLANMSHELRTPLNAILGFGELLHDGRVPSTSPQHKEFLGDILASGRHLLQLINGVLDLAKVESGKLDFFPSHVDLTKLVAEVVAVLRPIAAGKGMWLDTEVHRELGDIFIDPGRFKQVLYNYISNALKFTPNGGGISVSVRPDGPDSFRLEVKDTGVGIKEEDLGRLFVEFQQLDSGTTKRVGGTGLGLAVTKRMVEAQGGSVGVESTPGTGSTFHAVLRRRHLIHEIVPEQPSLDVPPGMGSVLVVEHNIQDRKTIVEILTTVGYLVDTASTGSEALAKCASRRYDAVTLDLLLPDVEGVEVLRALRAGSKNQEVPVIVITVVGERGAIGGFAVHDLLTKPLHSAELTESLERAGVYPPANGRVLVLDDDLTSLKLMSTTLKRLGYRDLCLTRGVDALRAASHEPPLAVILDLLMPGMDGFEFLDQFRKVPGCAALPVIVWTIKDLTPIESARLRASAQAVVQKGLGPESGGGVVGELGALLQPPVPRRT